MLYLGTDQHKRHSTPGIVQGNAPWISQLAFGKHGFVGERVVLREWAKGDLAGGMALPAIGDFRRTSRATEPCDVMPRLS
jgi:hypothetical protein